MLDVGGKIVGYITNLSRLFHGDYLSCFLELVANERYPFACGDFLQEHHVAKFEEWHTLVIEELLHQVFLAAKHTISYMLLMLPCGTQFFLKLY